MPSVIERLALLPTATASDVLRNLQVAYILDPAIHSLAPGVRVAGQAFTVLARAGSIITVHKALLEAPAGSVLVVGGATAELLNVALFGALMANQAKLRGLAGIVVDGAVRDLAHLRALSFPVFARAVTPHVGLNRAVGETQAPAPCGGLIVNPGDYVLGDDDGVVVIPAALIGQVVAETEARVRKEEEYLARMKAGEHLTDLIGLTKLIYGENAPDTGNGHNAGSK